MEGDVQEALAVGLKAMFDTLRGLLAWFPNDSAGDWRSPLFAPLFEYFEKVEKRVGEDIF